MIDVFDLFKKLLGRVNTQQGGAIRPIGNFIDWVNDVVVSLYEEKFATWEKSQKIVDDLSRPFLVSKNIIVVDGVAPFPDDYGHYSSARYYKSGNNSVPKKGLEIIYDEADCCDKNCVKKLDPNQAKPGSIPQEVWDVIVEQEELGAKNKKPSVEIPVDLISNDRYGSMLSSKFAGPSLTAPKISQYDKGFRVAPSDVKIIVLDYLKKPTPATFEYTVEEGDPLTGEGDYIVYNKEKSKPVEFSELVINEILTLLEKKYYKYIREPYGYEASEGERVKSV